MDLTTAKENALGGIKGGLVGIANASSVYVAMGLATASVAGLAAGFLGSIFPERAFSPYTAFCMGFCLPIGPLYLIFTSGWVMERQLKRYQRWKESGYITEAKHQELVNRMLGWLAQRRYGIPPTKAAGKPRKPPAALPPPSSQA